MLKGTVKPVACQRAAFLLTCAEVLTTLLRVGGFEGMTENERDVLQLRERPGDLAIRFRPVVRLLVLRFVQSGALPSGELEEFAQAATEKLLLRLPSLASHYDGTACVVTYVSAAIRNICLTLLHKRSRGQQFQPFPEDLAGPAYEPMAEMLIDDEVAMFGAILSQYHRRRSRLVLGLKLYFRHPISREDILLWHPRCPGSDLDVLLGVFGKDYDHLEEKDVFGILSPITAKAEGREIHPDSLRRWIAEKVDEIVLLLNGEPPISHHSHETVKLLAERFFSSNQKGTRVYTIGGETGTSSEGT
jgi:hypothetical protein